MELGWPLTESFSEAPHTDTVVAAKPGITTTRLSVASTASSSSQSTGSGGEPSRPKTDQTIDSPSLRGYAYVPPPDGLVDVTLTNESRNVGAGAKGLLEGRVIDTSEFRTGLPAKRLDQAKDRRPGIATI